MKFFEDQELLQVVVRQLKNTHSANRVGRHVHVLKLQLVPVKEKDCWPVTLSEDCLATFLQSGGTLTKRRAVDVPYNFCHLVVLIHLFLQSLRDLRRRLFLHYV